MSVTIQDSIFDGAGTTTPSDPSAVVVQSDWPHSDVRLLIEDSVFRDHRKVTGAALQVGGRHLDATIRRTRFLRNSVRRDVIGQPPYGEGAAIQINPDHVMLGVTPSYLRVLIEDSSFEDNESARLASAINETGSYYGEPDDVVVDIRRTSFVRNTSYEQGDAGGTIYGGPGSTFHLTDVDFGTGADENAPGDISNFPYAGQHLGAGVTLTFEGQ